MSAEIIGTVGEVLVELLREHLAVSPVERHQIALVSLADAASTDLRLGLFLYAVTQNAQLRNEHPPEVDPQGVRPPLTLDLHFLLTAYPGEGGSLGELHERTVEAQNLLSRAMQIFYENPFLTISQPGNDSIAGQRLRLTLNPIRVEELIRIWNAFPNVPLQPSVAYLVTPAEISPKA